VESLRASALAACFCRRSSDFKREAATPHGKDVVVRWEHDWPACPLQVLELRRIDELRQARRDRHQAIRKLGTLRAQPKMPGGPDA
jgi:hypothetical protein